MTELNETKWIIIDAVIDILTSHPSDQLTMRNIAKKAGLTTGAIYHYYKNKEELYFDVINQSLYFTNRLYETVKNSDDLAHGDTLLKIINEEVRIRMKKTRQQQLHIQLLSDFIKQNHEIKKQYQDNYRKMIYSTSELIVRAYNIDDHQKKQALAALLIATIDGLSLQQSLDVLPEELDKMIDVFIAFFNQSLQKFLEEN